MDKKKTQKYLVSVWQTEKEQFETKYKIKLSLFVKIALFIVNRNPILLKAILDCFYLNKQFKIDDYIDDIELQGD